MSGRKVGQGESRPRAQRPRRPKKQSSQVTAALRARPSAKFAQSLSSSRFSPGWRRPPHPISAPGGFAPRPAAIIAPAHRPSGAFPQMAPFFFHRLVTTFASTRKTAGMQGLSLRSAPMARMNGHPSSRPLRRCSRAASSTSSRASIPRCRRSSSSPSWSPGSGWASTGVLPPAPPILLFAVGIGIWTLTEYWLHRLVFHWEPKFRGGDRLHFIIHGVHHDHPNDAMRLVMPPAVSVPLAALFLGLYVLRLRDAARLPGLRRLHLRLPGLRLHPLPRPSPHAEDEPRASSCASSTCATTSRTTAMASGCPPRSGTWSFGPCRAAESRRRPSARQLSGAPGHPAGADPVPSSTAITLSATARAMPSRAGTVAEPMCGSSTQRGASSSRGETSGSFS